MSATTEVRAASAPSLTSRRRRNVMLTAVLAAILVAAGGLAWRWWTHPTAFSGLGDSYSSDPLPLADAALSTTVVFPRVSGLQEAITIEGLDATFSNNTAKADTTFWLCHMNADEDPIGAVRDPESVCSDSEAFRSPMSFDHGVAPDTDYLFVTITPTRRGVAHLKTVDIAYRRSGDHFYQRGTQAIPIDRKITVR